MSKLELMMSAYLDFVVRKFIEEREKNKTICVYMRDLFSIFMLDDISRKKRKEINYQFKFSQDDIEREVDFCPLLVVRIFHYHLYYDDFVRCH